MRLVSDQHLVAGGHLFTHLTHQVIDLAFHRTDLHFRIKKSCRTDNLLRPEKLMLRLILSRCRRDKEDLVDFALKFFKIQRTVVLG